MNVFTPYSPFVFFKWSDTEKAFVKRSREDKTLSSLVKDQIGNTDISLRGRRKKGRGRGEGETEKGREPYPQSPSPFSLPPYPLPPTPFDACYAGYTDINTADMYINRL